MSDEHDRLLAQGPRVAPEPQTATDDGALVPVVAPAAQAAPSAATTSADNPGRTSRAPGPGRSGSRARPSGWRRVIPIVLFALFIGARSFGSGHIEAALFGVVAVVVVTLILVHKARQL